MKQFNLAVCGMVVAVLCSQASPLMAQTFLRGDANGDGAHDIADAVTMLMYLFGGGPLDCHDAGDVNDDGAVNIADPITLLDYLFAGGPEPPAPFSEYGSDPTPDDLTCGAYNAGTFNYTDTMPPGYHPFSRRVTSILRREDLAVVGPQNSWMLDCDSTSFPGNVAEVLTELSPAGGVSSVLSVAAGQTDDDPAWEVVACVLRGLTKVDALGGPGGDAWDDFAILGRDPGRIERVVVKSGNYIDSLSVYYSSGPVLVNGGTGGNVTEELVLGDGEVITQIDLSRGGSPPCICYMCFWTSEGRKKEFAVNNRDKPSVTALGSLHAPTGVRAFFGGADNLLDRLGIYYQPEGTEGLTLSLVSIDAESCFVLRDYPLPLCFPNLPAAPEDVEAHVTLGNIDDDDYDEIALTVVTHEKTCSGQWDVAARVLVLDDAQHESSELFSHEEFGGTESGAQCGLGDFDGDGLDELAAVFWQTSNPSLVRLRLWDDLAAEPCGLLLRDFEIPGGIHSWTAPDVRLLVGNFDAAMQDEEICIGRMGVHTRAPFVVGYVVVKGNGALLNKVGPLGGPGGNAWDDYADAPGELRAIRKINVKSGDYIDSITTWYGACVIGNKHGGAGGRDNVEFEVLDGERITCIDLWRGGSPDAICSMRFTIDDGTVEGRTVDVAGDNRSKPSVSFLGSLHAPTGVRSFFGGAGRYIDRLGVYSAPEGTEVEEDGSWREGTVGLWDDFFLCTVYPYQPLFSDPGGRTDLGRADLNGDGLHELMLVYEVPATSCSGIPWGTGFCQSKGMAVAVVELGESGLAWAPGPVPSDYEPEEVGHWGVSGAATWFHLGWPDHDYMMEVDVVADIRLIPGDIDADGRDEVFVYFPPLDFMQCIEAENRGGDWDLKFFRNNMIGSIGGSGGTAWDDAAELGQDPGRIKNIVVRSGDYIDSITMYYENGTSSRHGGNGGDAPEELVLDEGEVITRIDLWRGGSPYAICSIRFTKNTGEVKDFGEENRAKPSVAQLRSLVIPSGVRTFFGGAGSYLDRLGVYYEPEEGAGVTDSRLISVPASGHMVAGDFDGDSLMLRHTGSNTLSLGDPVPVALLAAPPTIAGISQNYDETWTSYEHFEADSQAITATAGITITGWLGFEHVFFDLLRVSAKVKIGHELEKTNTVKTIEGQGEGYVGSYDNDSIVFQGTLYNSYEYEVIATSDPGAAGSLLTLDVPVATRTFMWDLDYYNRLMPDHSIDPSVLQYARGHPETYMTKQDAVDLLDRYVGWMTLDGPVCKGNWATSKSISLEAEEASTETRSWSISLENEYKAGPVVAGYSVGATMAESYTFTILQKTSYKGSVGCIGSEDDYEAWLYDWGFLVYNRGVLCDDMNEPAGYEEGVAPIQIITYWTMPLGTGY